MQSLSSTLKALESSPYPIAKSLSPKETVLYNLNASPLRLDEEELMNATDDIRKEVYLYSNYTLGAVSIHIRQLLDTFPLGLAEHQLENRVKELEKEPFARTACGKQWLCNILSYECYKHRAFQTGLLQNLFASAFSKNAIPRLPLFATIPYLDHLLAHLQQAPLIVRVRTVLCRALNFWSSHSVNGQIAHRLTLRACDLLSIPPDYEAYDQAKSLFTGELKKIIQELSVGESFCLMTTLQDKEIRHQISSIFTREGTNVYSFALVDPAEDLPTLLGLGRKGKAKKSKINPLVKFSSLELGQVSNDHLFSELFDIEVGRASRPAKVDYLNAIVSELSLADQSNQLRVNSLDLSYKPQIQDNCTTKTPLTVIKMITDLYQANSLKGKQVVTAMKLVAFVLANREGEIFPKQFTKKVKKRIDKDKKSIITIVGNEIYMEYKKLIS